MRLKLLKYFIIDNYGRLLLFAVIVSVILKLCC